MTDTNSDGVLDSLQVTTTFVFYKYNRYTICGF